MEGTGLRIGEVASRTGVSIDALRVYEKRLLGRARRSSGGFRLFAHETVQRVLFIRQAQDLGFSLAEIGELLATGGADECRKVRGLLRIKLAELDERMESMRKFRRVLARHLRDGEHELQEHGKAACCPVVALTLKILYKIVTLLSLLARVDSCSGTTGAVLTNKSADCA